MDMLPLNLTISPNLKSYVEDLNPDRSEISRRLMQRIKSNYEDGLTQVMTKL